MFEPIAADLNAAEWEFCHTLCTQRGWIKRRVDKITLLNDDTTRIHSTFDINIAKLHKIVDDFLPLEQRQKRIPIPILERAPIPILNIDVQLNGAPQSIAGRSASARYAECTILHNIQQTVNLFEKAEFPTLSKHLFEWVRTGHSGIVRSALEDAEDIEEKINNEVISYDQLVSNPATLSSLTYGWLWSDILSDESTQELIIRYSSVHLVVVYLDTVDEGTNAVLKITQDFPTTRPTNGILFGLTGASYHIASSPLGSNSEGRYHLKIESPDEFKVSSLEIKDRDAKSPPWYKRRQNINVSDDTRIVSTRNLLEIHIGKDRSSEASKDLTVRFDPSIEVFTARALALVALLVGYVFLVNETTFEAKEIAAIAMAIGAIAVTMPVLFRGHSESLYVAQMLQFNRGLLGFIIGFTLLVGVAHKTSRVSDGLTAPLLFIASLLLGLYFIFLIISAVLSHYRVRRFKHLLRQHEQASRGI